MTVVDRATGVAGLRAAFESLDSLLAGLAPADWATPTCLPAWDVQANVAHLIGIEAMLLGEPEPAGDDGDDVAALPHVHNPLGASNERWVRSMAAMSPAEVLDGYRRRVSARVAALEAATDADWNAEAMTPLGPDSYGRFMRIRTMDVWMHEQDIREAVGRPGHADGPVIDLVLDEMAPTLGYVVGKKAGAPDGTAVTFSLRSPDRELHVVVDGRAKLVESLPGDATVVLIMPALTFTRLAGGRTTDASDVAVDGDESLGGRILANLAFMI